MHLGRDRAGKRAGFSLGRPQLKLGMALGEKFENGETVEHDKSVGLERRNPAGRRMTQDGRPALRLAQTDTLLGEGDAAMLHGDPGTKAPGGEVLVADEESVTVCRHDPALRHCHCGAPLPLMRPAIKPVPIVGPCRQEPCRNCAVTWESCCSSGEARSSRSGSWAPRTMRNCKG